MSEVGTSLGATMRAAVLHGLGDLRVEPRPVPSPVPGEVLLQTGTVGLCGTDASEYTKGPSLVPLEHPHAATGHVGPMIIGHEFSGTVVAVGEGVGRSWVGRPVACCGAMSCGECWQCRRGRTNLCVSYAAVGLHRDGALAEYVAAPLASCAAVDDLGLTPDAAALGQPMSIAVHARDRARLASGERAVVVGVGGIGAFLVHAAAATTPHVVALDPVPARLDLARRLGASAALDPSADAGDVVAAVGGAPHVVYKSSGNPAGLARALELLPPGGRLVLVGLQKAAAELDLRRATLIELEIIGTNAMVRFQDFDQALRLVAARAEGWSDVAPDVLPLAGVAPSLTALGTGQPGPVKILVDPKIVDRRPADTVPRRSPSDHKKEH